jgi:hypothetical protein
MSLQSPWWLLLLALVPLVVILHAIAVRWRSARVSSLSFWSDAMRERRTSARLRRVLLSLALVLQVLAIAALSISLAGPRIAGRGYFAPGDTILVLDTTASMKTRDGAHTRFDLGRSLALEVLDGIRGGSRMAIVTAGRAARVALPFSADRRVLRGAIGSAAATDEPGNLKDGLLLAFSLRDAGRGDQIVAVTDGACDLPATIDLTVPWLRVLQVGSPRSNIAITAMQLRRTLRGEEYELFLSVKNYSPRPVEVPLTFSTDRSPDGKPIVSQSVPLAPGEERALSLPWRGPVEGRVTASLRTGDDFPVDDEAYAVLAPARSVKALLAGPSDPFLEKGLSSLPNIALRKAGLWAGESFDLIVFDGAEVPPLEKGNYILFGSVPPNLPVRILGELRAPSVTSWARSHPLLESVSLEGLAIDRTIRLEPGQGFSSLAWSHASPLLLVWDQGGLRVIMVGFDVRRTDFPLRAGFPIFLANALSWFFPSWLSVQADQVQAGAPLLLPAGAGELVVERPYGGRETVESDGQAVEYTNTSETGFYRAHSISGTREFAVNLLSPEESDISPRLPTGGGKASGTAESPVGKRGEVGNATGAPLWGSLAVIAALLVLAEWLAAIRLPGMRRTRR